VWRARQRQRVVTAKTRVMFIGIDVVLEYLSAAPYSGILIMFF